MGPKPMADALEALLAALYLDVLATGREAATPVQALVERRFLDTIRQARPDTLAAGDPKTSLQETAARLGLPAPLYSLLQQTGPGHAPRFTIRVTVGDQEAQAEGTTRKRAESTAAQRLLDGLRTAPSL